MGLGCEAQPPLLPDIGKFPLALVLAPLPNLPFPATQVLDDPINWVASLAAIASPAEPGPSHPHGTQVLKSQSNPEIGDLNQIMEANRQKPENVFTLQTPALRQNLSHEEGCAFPSCSWSRAIAKDCTHQMCPEHCRLASQEEGKLCVKHPHQPECTRDAEAPPPTRRIRKPSKKALNLQDTTRRWNKTAV